MQHILEVCTDSIASVEIAKQAGAYRVELCSGLSDGGLTPSLALIQAAVKTGIRVNVLIRPRSGDFLYSPHDIDIMINDIKAAANIGANGIVIGALCPDGSLDIEACKKMIDAAGNLEITFHRAFDVCADPFKAIDQLVSLNVNRILTSGQAENAKKGMPMLKRFVEYANNRISIMAGCGINLSNAKEILMQTGVTELHASCRIPISSTMVFRNPNVHMGLPGIDEYANMCADYQTIKQIVNL